MDGTGHGRIDDLFVKEGRGQMSEPTLRGGRPIPDDYPLDPEDLTVDGDCIADVPAEKLQALADYYGDDDPPGEPVPDGAERV